MKLGTLKWDKGYRCSKLIVINFDDTEKFKLEITSKGGVLLSTNDKIQNFRIRRTAILGGIAGAAIEVNSQEVFRFSRNFLWPTLEIANNRSAGRLKIKGYLGETQLTCDDLQIKFRYSFRNPTAEGIFGNSFKCVSDHVPILFGFFLNEFGNFESSVA